MNVFDMLFRSMVRGFGWGVGRRAASRVPLWPAVVVIVLLYIVGRFA